MKKKTKLLLVIFLVLILLGALCAITFLRTSTGNNESRRLYLPEGTTQEALVDTLQTHGILTNGKKTKLFNFKFSIFNSSVRPGSYIVEPHMNELALLRKLRNGLQDPIRLTIGKFRLPQDLNNYLNQKLMHDDFNIPIDSFHLILPDTYEVYWTITPEQFMQRMGKENYRFWEGMPTSVHLPPIDAVILASIVEEETNNKSEKPLIASVYINRIEKGMPLQADPTVKYAVGDFSLRRILNKHLAVESPFNTYLHTGLPPAPICLPSKESIKAVVFAPQTNYLYFCASDRMDGTHRFAATLAEHNRNAARYHAALARLKNKN